MFFHFLSVVLGKKKQQSPHVPIIAPFNSPWGQPLPTTRPRQVGHMDENGMRISCTAESNPAKKGLAKIEIFGFRINIIKYDL